MSRLRLVWGSVLALACADGPAKSADPAPTGGGSGDGGGTGDSGGSGDSGDTGGSGDSGGSGGGDGAPWALLSGIYGSQYVEGVAVTTAGDVVFGGSFENGVDLGDGGFASRGRDDALLGTLAGADGSLAWNVVTGDGGTDVIYDVAVAPDGAVYAAGWFDGELAFPEVTLTSRGDYDGFLARWEAGGTHTWAVQLGGAGDDRMRSVAADLDGACVAGFTESGISGTGLSLPARSLLDGVVVCVDPDGAPRWGVTLGLDAGTAPALAVAVGPDGVRAGGYFTESVDLGAGRQDSLGGRDAWLILWPRAGGDGIGRALGAVGDQEVLGLAVFDGQTAAVGSWSGGPLPVGDATSPAGDQDAVLVLLDASLEVTGAELVGGAGRDVALDVAVDAAGTWAVTGWTDGAFELVHDHPPLGDRDLWLGVRDATTWTHSARLGGAGEDVGRSVAWHPSGDLVVGGTSAGRCEISGTALDGYGDRDLLLARVAP